MTDLLQDMYLFVEVAKALSFSRAAEVLDLPTSTVSRRIAGLEKRVGVQLIYRTTRRFELTEAGRAYFDRCRAITEEALLAHEDLMQVAADPSGHLRISVTGDFGTLFLAPYLVKFRELYPNITFAVDMSPRFVDLAAERYDLAIRIGEINHDSNVIARRMALLPVRLYAAPQYLSRRGIPETPGDLVNHDCITVTTSAGTVIWKLMCGSDVQRVAADGPIAANSLGMIRRLTLLGVGIGYLDEVMVQSDVQAKRLQPVLPNWQLTPVPVHAVTTSRLLPARTRVFIDFLYEKLFEMRAAASGASSPIGGVHHF